MSRRYQPYKLFLPVAIFICLIGVSTLGACTPPATPTTTPPPTATSPSPKPSTPAPTATPAPAAPLTTTSLPSGKVGTSYIGTLAAGGGTSPYTWSLVSGNLPAGLSLGSAGTISGTPTSAGTFNFTVQVKDSGNPAMTVQGALSIVIVPPTLMITVTSLPAGRAGTAYGTLFTAAGGTTPYAWSIASGSLPSGVTLSADGTILGVPDSGGTFTFTAQVKDSSVPALTAQATLSIVIAPPPISVTTTVLPLGRGDTAYNTSLLTSAGTAPFNWSVVSGNLPPGLTLSAAGVISGTPAAIGTFDFIVRVTDSSTPPLTTQAALSITITFATPLPLSIVTPYLPLGRAGVSYSAAFVATGGVAPYTWSVISGSVPAGLSLSANGVLSGIPAFSGTFNFVVRVADSSSPANTVERTFVLVV